jgi:predicted MPP superfamily phosphohydrolase
MTILNILHVSDLHISEEHFHDQEIILKALWKDLGGQRHPRPDLIFFTGDLIAKGQYSKENISLARAKFIEPLLTATGLPTERLFIVPGNHDVNLKERSPYVAPIFESLKDQDSVSNYLKEAQQHPLSVGLESFNIFRESLKLNPSRASHPYFSAHCIEVGSLKVGLCCLNSAWRATGAPHDGDYGKLLISRFQIESALAALPERHLTLGLFHHPANWLAPFDSGVTQRQLSLHFDAIFYGHNHEGEGIAVAGSSGAYFASNAACLYQAREFSNGYSFITYDTETNGWTVNAREYFEQRQSFDECTRFAPEGTQSYFIQKGGNSVAERFPSQDFIKSVGETVDGHLLSSLVSRVAPKSLRAMFVEPPLSRLSQRQIAGEKRLSDPSLYVQLKELLASKDAIFFVGPRESGKTTLLHRICLLSGEMNLIGFPPFCTYVDMGNTVETRAKILDSITQFSGGSYRRRELLKMLASGLFAVCFDNFEVENERHQKLLSDFTKEFPSCRYFFAVCESIDSSLTTTTIPNLGLTAQVFFIHSFGRREARALTKNWFGELDVSSSDKVDEILSLLARLNIPRTPFLISAMLWIKESQLVFSPVNQASILDTFIDGVFDKLSESKERTGVDSTIKRHFLATFAEHLSQLNVRRIPFVDLEQFTLDYFRKRALTNPTGSFITSLLLDGMLMKVNGHVGFKFNCIRAFFLAARLKESPGLLEGVLTLDRIIHFGEELDYFTGSARDRRDVLARSVELLRKFHAEAALDLDLSYFNDISLHHSPFTAERKAELTDKILGSRVQGEKREQLLDRIDLQRPEPTLEDPSQETPTVQITDPVRRFVTCLQIVSSILRNSELVEDAQLKRDAYDAIAGYWCELLIAVLVAVDFMDENSQELEALRHLLPLGNPSLVGYFLKIFAPTVIINVALECLGTAKLQLIMEDSILRAKDTAKQVLSAFLYTDLRLPVSDRGRDAHYCAPPAQNRAGPIRALGFHLG